MKNSKPLTIYKASAGSGKTFTLAVEYMKLVILNPQNYRNILAVTFTNKATEEMKMRILSQLYGISKDDKDSRKYKEKLVEETGLGEEKIKQNVNIALRNLLHNYNYFRIETIDAFFQSVLRNLARELDLTANLKIGLNDYQVEELAVDELIENLESHDKILTWIIEYIDQNIADDKGWNVIGKIKRFGATIFKDFYKENSRKLNEVLEKDNFFSSYTRKLRSIKHESEEKLKFHAKRFFDILDKEGLEIEDFSKGASGVCGYFVKLRDGKFSDKELLTKTAVSGMELPEEWVLKAEANPTNEKFRLVQTILMPLLNETEYERPQLVKIYKSADLTLRHLNQLRLLSSIERKVQELNAEANRFLLSDTQSLLHALIDDSDSPFIFEKIGSQLEHVMIDEFQDTSVVQWSNFKVLLLECMSHTDAENLIVGDVKQSIYRWRSGDWRLLNEIEKEFPSPQLQLDIRNLQTNYRSQRNIVEFNNEFFSKASAAEYKELAEDNPAEALQMEHAYADVCQKSPAKEAEGLVRIELYTETDDILENLSKNINELRSLGIGYNKMAILVRNNKDIQLLADYFSHTCPDVPLVSDEAFRLDSSRAVCTLISALRFLIHPDNQLEQAFLENIEGNRDFFLHRDDLISMPLYDLAELLLLTFNREDFEQQGAYICAFFDQLNKFLQENIPDIDAFLKEWDETICQKTIQSGDVQGIRLLTIHKSKGLEFDNVFIPFCDWRLEKSGTTIWCKPGESPFDELPLAPIDFSSKQLMGSIYEKDYLHEHLQNVVDNMNLLYVAFTRASRNLFISGKRGTAATRTDIIEKVIEPVSASLKGSILEGDIKDKKSSISFSYGTISISKNEEKNNSGNVFMQKPEILAIEKLENFHNNAEFRQSNKSKNFIEAGGEDEQNQFIKLGSILHATFSMIHTADDIESALRKLELEGILYDENLNAEKLKELLQKRLESPRIRDWFSPQWQLFNECTILHVDPNTNAVVEHRPDRVMTNGKETIVVDFKFGNSRDEYRDQIKLYMQLLRDMGHENVKGYLWFVYSNKIEEVA
ncbi:exodeoxyribonuclease V subunit beta [Prevotella sp. KH2C16]|uniref:UvrD-helicase domain-containing protein n=1 Tax=Prevotella sp. KH2C16 TaxID=1855325 RepID=UPI0008F224A7|nr:UvrD-helicase domain-containing protein [Prevotella sp. KH2C16]SFG12527.1 ATP-dependent exoDNAse (exonuclease V) beta subunit (contains helicase and exonuclease domains) [Prevotella sp. KH2C16]